MNSKQEKILRVEAYDDDPELIVVELNDSNTIMLSLEPKLDDPLFAEIKTLNKPRTDGFNVFWSNGATLSSEEIMEMLRSNGE
mgnify:CR=1 FL=1